MDTTPNTIENNDTSFKDTNLEDTHTGTAKIDSLTHDELKSYAQQLAAEFDTSATQLTSLQTDVDKYMRIAAGAQTQYRTMYEELEGLRKRASQEKLMTKIELFKKITPGIFKLLTDLKNILAGLTPEQKDQPIWKSTLLLPTAFEDYMVQHKIYKIKTLGEAPDATYHEVVMTREVTAQDIYDDHTVGSLSGKIIQELDAGYYIIEGEIPYVLKPATVVVGV